MDVLVCRQHRTYSMEQSYDGSVDDPVNGRNVNWLSKQTTFYCFRCVTFMPGFINTHYSQIISYSAIKQQTRIINLKSQFILWISRRT